MSSSRLFPVNFLSWVKSYLSDRKQYVGIGECFSDQLSVMSGVPQGSLFGPYLFCVVIGSFSQARSDSFLMKYADDCAFCFPLYAKQSNDHVLREHKRFLSWCREVGFLINYQKCKSLIIRSRQECHHVLLPDVKMVKSLKLLGVTFQENLAWNTHFDNVALSSSRRLGALLSRNELKLVYFSTARSILEFSNPLFLALSPTDQRRLECVQRRFHKLLCGSACREACLPSLLQCRRAQLKRLFRAAASPEHVLNRLLPTCASRSGRFLLPSIRSLRFKKAFMNQCAIFFTLKRK